MKEIHKFTSVIPLYTASLFNFLFYLIYSLIVRLFFFICLFPQRPNVLCVLAWKIEAKNKKENKRNTR